MTAHVINLSEFGGPVFAGRPRGERIREHLELDTWDQDPAELVRVIVPQNTLGITASFIGGLFSRSVRAAGSRNEFFRRFSFELPAQEPERAELLRRVIEAEVDRALFDAKGVAAR